MNSIYLAQYNNGYNMMNGSSGWGIFMTLFWATIIILIVVLIARTVNGRGVADPKGDDALDIAKKRYAKGEITKTEFEQIKRDIK